MIDLSNVTIVNVNCVNPTDGLRAIRYSQRGINFKEAILISHENIKADGVKCIQIEKLKSVDEYNDFMLRLVDYVGDSDYVLVVQDDGFVLTPELWDPEFLNFDYLGAPWPDQPAWKELQVKGKYFMTPGWNRVGNGGFSLRSKKFIELSASWDSCTGFGEDFFLCVINQKYMEAQGIKFAPVELARKFSYENNIDNWPAPVELDPTKHFGFHGHQLTNSHRLIALKEKG